MTDQLAYSETEQEIIVLRAVWDMIDGLVNYSIFEKRHGTIDATLFFSSMSASTLFNALLADFLSSPRKGTFGLPKTMGDAETDKTFLFYLRRIASDPYLNVSSASISIPVESFITWLEGECSVDDVWFPTVPIETNIRVKRMVFLKICGNISKHNFSRLNWVVDEIVQLLSENGVEIDAEQGYLLLPEFYKWFHNDIFFAHSSAIAEHLNNIRWGIFNYLCPEFERSYEKPDPKSVAYQYNYPEECQNPLAKAMYWDLMNQVRSKPYFPRFTADKMLTRRYTGKRL